MATVRTVVKTVTWSNSTAYVSAKAAAAVKAMQAMNDGNPDTKIAITVTDSQGQPHTRYMTLAEFHDAGKYGDGNVSNWDKRAIKVAAERRRSLNQTRTLLDASSLILPRKITDECFGDLLETLEEMADSMPGWRLQIKALISVGWASLFTLREVGKPGVVLAVIWRLIFG